MTSTRTPTNGGNARQLTPRDEVGLFERRSPVIASAPPVIPSLSSDRGVLPSISKEEALCL